uniref:Uncharacterized protein n=1 Tax=viral metagenome TaxID=1070528 RepID=A0A6C0BQT4_9ZZZZ
MFYISNTTVYQLAYQTACLLKKSQYKLQKIKWSYGESNPDTEFSQLACQCCKRAWTNMKKMYDEYEHINIKCYPPDITIMFTLNNKSIYKHIELKSSKKNTLIGSTINTLDINQPLIFCLRPSSQRTNNCKYQIRYSKYYQAVGRTTVDKFQDRTPRPNLNFTKMFEIDRTFQDNEDKTNSENWIEHYSQCALNRLNRPNNSVNCKKSWQDDLILCIKKKVLEEFIHETTIINFKKIKAKILK